MINLKKTIEVNETGVTVEHWEVIQVNINFIGSNALVKLRGFKTKADKDNGANPIGYETVYIVNDDSNPNDLITDFDESGLDKKIEVAVNKHLKEKATKFNGAIDD